MSASPATACLKVDVDTHDGMRDGVPVLLDVFKEFRVHATFFPAFGPDNSGKAIWNVFRKKGFLKKMLRTGAPKLYGWRTILSGTLLPARMIASKFPDIVRRIADEGHEVGVHAWDHRLWQDHLDRLDGKRVEEQLARSFDAYERILGKRPRAVAAPAWYATTTSLKAQDRLGLLYASDMRGGAPGYPDLEGYPSSTLQIPTTQPCLEELLVQGADDLPSCVDRILTSPAFAGAQVIPLHAEVEGGVYRPFLEMLLRRLKDGNATVMTLEEQATRLLSQPEPPPRMPVALSAMNGRAGAVLAPVQTP